MCVGEYKHLLDKHGVARTTWSSAAVPLHTGCQAPVPAGRGRLGRAGGGGREGLNQRRGDGDRHLCEGGLSDLCERNAGCHAAVFTRAEHPPDMPRTPRQAASPPQSANQFCGTRRAGGHQTRQTSA